MPLKWFDYEPVKGCEIMTTDLDQQIEDIKRRRDRLNRLYGRGRRRSAPGRPKTRDQRIAEHRQQIKLLKDEILPTFEPGSYAHRVATRSLKDNQSELRILTGHEKPGDRNRRATMERQAMRGAIVEAVTK
jgi:hypothetical protein